jgi:hypothetical protein
MDINEYNSFKNFSLCEKLIIIVEWTVYAIIIAIIGGGMI